MPKGKTSTPQKPLLQQSPDDRGKKILMVGEGEEEEEEGDEEEPSLSSKHLLSLLQPQPSSSPDDNSPSCFSLLNYTCTPKLQAASEKLSDAHELWRESQRAATVNISRQLKSKWAFDVLIDAQLAKFKAHYTGDASSLMLPSHVPDRLFPSWNPSLFTASLSWLGDTWRPSTILSLIGPALGLTSPLSARSQRALGESIRRFRIEEAVLDEEMAEYESMSVLNLRAAGTNRKGRRGSGAKLGMVCEEMRKVGSVMERAQRLRYKAMEAALKGGALNETQACVFLMALVGVEEAVRLQAVRWRTRAGAAAIEVQAFD